MGLTRRIIENRGGSSEVDREPGKGSTFTLSFVWPIAPGAQGKSSKHDEGAAEASIDPQGLSFSRSDPPRILLAEDDPIGQKVALAFLDAFGCKVDVVANGQDAVEMVAQTKYDLVFMDVQMPVMDGLTATRTIRKSETTHRLPIVAMTAHAMREDRDRCI